MWAITRGNHPRVNELIGSLSGMRCTGGIFVSSGADYNVELLDNSATRINCLDTGLVSNIAKIKSVGIFSNTKRAVEALVLNKTTNLLMHFNALNSSNEFIDDSYSSGGHDILKTGLVSINDTDSVPDFGGGSAEPFAVFPASDSNYFIIKDKTPNDGIDFNFTDKDFTIEAWVKFDSINKAHTIVSQWKENRLQFSFYYGGDIAVTNPSYHKLAFQYRTPTANVVVLSDNQLSLANAWHHVAVERKGSNIYLFVDGVLKGSGNIGTAKINDFPDEDIYVGISLVNTTSPVAWSQFRGDMDELRITKGVARFPTTEETDQNGDYPGYFTPWDIEYARNN